MTPSVNEHYLETKQVIDAIVCDSPQGQKKKCAIFAMVQNEPVFLPLWLTYYGRFFDGDDMFIFDHRTSDDSVDKAAEQFHFRRFRLDYPFSFDHQWFQFVAENVQHKLLADYEYVIFTDIDEILMVNPKKYKGLGDYIHRVSDDFVQCVGYELIHMKKKEHPIKLDKPVLSQRKYWYRNKMYDKTLLSRKPLHWKIGFHGIDQPIPRKDEDFYLIHLHKLDFDMSHEKTFKRSQLPWNEVDLKNNWGWQNRITDDEKFYDFFYKWPRGLEITKIPRTIRKTNLF